MRVFGNTSQLSSTRSTAIGLLIASLSCIAILTVAVTRNTGDVSTLFNMRELLIIGVLAGVVFFAGVASLLAFRAVKSAARFEQRAAKEIAHLRKHLVTAESIAKAEPQLLMIWERGLAHIASNNLTSVPGIPEAQADIFQFANWLENEAVNALGAAMDKLLADGQPFNRMLKTRSGAYIEADGRAAGGRAILKIRDTAGHRRDLGRLIDMHRQLSSKVETDQILMSALPMPVWFRNEEGALTWVNDAYIKSVEALSLEDCLERQIELLEARQRAEVSEKLAANNTYRKRMHVVTIGERRTFDLVAERTPGGSIGAAIDVAALESFQGELERQSEAHDRMLDRVTTAVAIYGNDQRLTFFNNAFYKLWNLDPDWLQSRPLNGEILDKLRQMRHLPEQADYRAWKKLCLSNYGADEADEDWWHLPDGRTIHVVAEPRPDGGLAYLYDNVTEKFALESRYNALIRAQRETLDNLQEGVAVFATDGRLQLFNQSFARIWKLDKRVLGQSPHIEDIISHCRVLFDDAHSWAKIRRSVTTISDRRQNIDGQMGRDDGSIIAFAGVPLPDGATLFTYIDITDSKRVENALIERNEALEVADQLKNQFMSHVSYELRTPLQSIIGFSEVLASPIVGELNDKQREYLDDIHASSRTLLAVINDILDLATIDAGTFELKLASVSINDIIEGLIKSTEAAATEAGMEIIITNDTSGLSFVADEIRVGQVLNNIINNAIGFSECGGRVEFQSRSTEGMVVFTVKDHGKGISERDQERVFERFESKAKGSNHRGAGLGLPIVKSIVELHHGDVKLLSREGGGTEIMVSFPLAGPNGRNTISGPKVQAAGSTDQPKASGAAV